MIPDYDFKEPIRLPEQGHWAEAVHRLDRLDAVALRAAEACGRPLLIKGRPGVGKSQLARAAAAFAGRPLLSVVIDGRSEAQDLMWRFDAVRRLADAQSPQKRGTLRPEGAYVRPEALWWAYDWAGAQRWLARQGCNSTPPVSVPPGWEPGQAPAVLLIDEIDKADPDLPNALLDVLAHNGFCMPFGGGLVQCPAQARPLTLITTNDERELPDAFKRRCLTLTLELPADKDEFLDYVVKVGSDHQKVRRKRNPQAVCHLLDEAALRLWEARLQLGAGADYLPGLAEYLDLTAALARLHDTAQAQRDALADLQRLVYRKG